MSVSSSWSIRAHFRAVLGSSFNPASPAETDDAKQKAQPNAEYCDDDDVKIYTFPLPVLYPVACCGRIWCRGNRDRSNVILRQLLAHG